MHQVQNVIRHGVSCHAPSSMFEEWLLCLFAAINWNRTVGFFLNIVNIFYLKPNKGGSFKKLRRLCVVFLKIILRKKTLFKVQIETFLIFFLNFSQQFIWYLLDIWETAFFHTEISQDYRHKGMRVIASAPGTCYGALTCRLPPLLLTAEWGWLLWPAWRGWQSPGCAQRPLLPGSTRHKSLAFQHLRRWPANPHSRELWGFLGQNGQFLSRRISESILASPVVHMKAPVRAVLGS